MSSIEDRRRSLPSRDGPIHSFRAHVRGCGRFGRVDRAFRQYDNRPITLGMKNPHRSSRRRMKGSLRILQDKSRRWVVGGLVIGYWRQRHEITGGSYPGAPYTKQR